MSVSVWSKPGHEFRRKVAAKAFTYTYMTKLTLNIKSRSPKSDHFLKSSHWLIHVSLPVWSKSGHYFSSKRVQIMFIIALNETLVSLKNRSRSPKSYHFLKALPTMYLCQFGENMAIGSESSIQVRFFSMLFDLDNDPGQWWPKKIGQERLNNWNFCSSKCLNFHGLTKIILKYSNHLQKKAASWKNQCINFLGLGPV